ncbi:MAG: thiosulfate oxidation carrier complex protein SoxZ [Chitinimonas sp.]|nr:thiosulfate oxidation carrier complex protein SoxZ [Chitinimonas sp.]
MSIRIAAKLLKDITEIEVRATGPSEDGQRADPKTGKLIPVNYLQQLLVKVDGRLLTEAHLGGGLSANNVFLFKARSLRPGATITVEWARTEETRGKDGRPSTAQKTGSETLILGK